MRKRFIFSVLLAIFVAINPLVAAAHSGRTDAFGGHYNRKTGEYHFHNAGKGTITPKDVQSVERRQKQYNTTDGPLTPNPYVSPSSKTPSPAKAPSYTRTPSPTKTSSGISVIIDGKALEFATPPIMAQDRVLVPLRGVFEALGAVVDWDGENRMVSINCADKTITLKIGETRAKINGNANSLDVPPRIVNGSTMVPLRFVSEALGAKVGWEDATNTVSITSAD